MDLYSNNRMLDWEARRRVIELRSMSHRAELEDSREESQDTKASGFMDAGCIWNSLFHRTSHDYERA